MNKTWKSVELRLAKMFGTKRTPLSGGNSGHTRSDTLHKRLFIELKHGNSSTIKTMWKEWDKDVCVLVKSHEIVLSMLHTSNLTERMATKLIVIKRKNFGAIKLFKETEELAKLENKIPVVVLHKKGTHGFLLIAKASDFEQIKKEILDEF